MIAPLPVSMEVQQGSFVIGPDTWIMMGPFTTFSFEPTLAFKEVTSHSQEMKMTSLSRSRQILLQVLRYT